MLLLALSWGIAGAEPASHDPADDQIRPDGIHILDGSYVLDLGELQVNITNHGLIGSQFSADVPYNHAPSGQWPGGSGDEYLWGAGLWVGGRIAGQVSVTTGQYERELRPGSRLVDTIYEAQASTILRPTPYPQKTGRRLPEYPNDDDQDGRIDEDFLNGRDDDGDGLVDEDFAQLGDQMLTCTMFDNLPLISEIYPGHRPLNIKVVQRAFGWYHEELENVIGLDFEVTNVGYETVEDVYLGFFVDGDIQRRGQLNTQPDDLAGFFKGAVRDDNGVFYRANIAYMRDGDPDDPLPGVLGLMLIDHTTDFLGRFAPQHPELHGFQIFATNAAPNQDGEPNTDEDRYYLMSRRQHDRDVHPDEANDFKYMVSSGPFGNVTPGTTLNLRLAMVIGDGYDDMLRKAVVAAKTGKGRWFNEDMDGSTGWGGRETKVCLGDFPAYEDGSDPILWHWLDHMNEECSGGYAPGLQPVLHPDLLEPDEDGNLCIWVNLDNCEECFAGLGHDCNDVEYHATGSQHIRTGTYGREAQYHWSRFTEIPPPAPGFRVLPGSNQVEVLWDDRSEHSLDPNRGINDFESYQVWRVHHWTRPLGLPAESNPPNDMWGMIAEFDVINTIAAGVGGTPNERPLGRNTGLEVAVYTPACLSDARFTGLAAAMQQVVDSDDQGQWIVRPSVRTSDGTIKPEMLPLVPWETYTDVLDTFFAVTARVEGVPKRGTRYYHYTDREAPNGFLVYYAVTASDHQVDYMDGEYYPSGYGVFEEPGNLYVTTTPRTDAQTPDQRTREGINIYVYPNPATLESLQEYNAQLPSFQNPSGVQVTWNNLPRAHNTIHVFTEAGDLVKTLKHDGFSQGGSLSWNLISRNQQEIVSGIYLYVVKSDNAAFDDFQGRFVVIN